MGVKVKLVALTSEQVRIRQHLETICLTTGRIIKPYWNYIPRAKKLYPNVGEKKARGLFRGYVKQLIDQGLLQRVGRGRYYLVPAAIMVKEKKPSRRQPATQHRSFAVKRGVGDLPLEERRSLIHQEIRAAVTELQQLASYLNELLRLADEGLSEKQQLAPGFAKQQTAAKLTLQKMKLE